MVVDGAVRHPRRFTLADLAALGECEVGIAVHCVWGWSRPDTRWVGVPAAAVLDLVEPEGEWATVTAASDAYSACLPIDDVARGMFAWERDGQALAPEAGGPLRFVPPADYWAYKGVKWAARMTVGDTFRPGHWEARVADPLGRIPEEVFE
jgi:DMSO/TMAO reductase YedYZ molybdopterin-dependent catalytic subunit